MKLLIFWDIYGRIGRKALKKELPLLRKKYNPDFIIANIDNITSGRWAIEKHILEMESIWIDVMTAWDHFFDNLAKIKDYLKKKDRKLLRFANLYNEDTIWEWYRVFEKNGKKLLVIHLQWEVFMNHKVYNPFLKAKEILEKFKLEKLDAIIIDLHKEVTSELSGLAYFLDWKVSFIFWTHTHVQTNDETILEKWSWFITDIWMNWSLNSIIWANFESVKGRFLDGINKWKIEQSLDKNYLISACYVETWKNWTCKKIEKIRKKGILE